VNTEAEQTVDQEAHAEPEAQAPEEPQTEPDTSDSAVLEAESDGEPADAPSSEESEADTVSEPEEIDDGRAWYVLHSYSGYENKVKRNLEHRIESMNMQDRVFRVVVPTEEEIEIKEGNRRRTKRRIFPGYVLVQMIMDDESWSVVRNTPGVTGFVSSGSGSKPTPLRPAEVEQILARMQMEAPKIKVSFREGQSVRILDGPFADFVGTVEELNLDKGKVRVMVSFFGRETPVELDFLQVQGQ
jgi:transcriptional antiterminator NusG